MAIDPALTLEVRALSRMRSVQQAELTSNSNVYHTYRDSVIFITGGTGFIGKQLVEKLLRVCQDIKKIYLLSRSKKGKTMQERLRSTLQDPVFGELRKRCPEFEDKISPIEGDVAEINLGINDQDWRMISDEINFIFHAAATVRFDEPLKAAILSNVRGTREALRLARNCSELKCFVYYSTAYAHCNRSKQITEKFYESPIPPQAAIEFVESVDEKKIDAITSTLIEGWPNTYTFSKAIAEEAVRTMAKGLPICVVRPAIVSPAYREPLPGWLDISNVSGPSGVVLGSGLGIIRCIWVDYGNWLDLVPVDYVNNLAIAASCETVRRNIDGAHDIKIYTMSRKRNPVSWGQMQNFLETEARNLISPKAVWYCFSLATSNKYLYMLYTLLLHTIPALLIDCVLALMGKKLRLRRVYEKAYKVNSILQYFLFNEWIQHDDNTLDLIQNLPSVDREILNFDVANVDFTEFMSFWCLGLRKYIIKDGLKDTEYAIKKQFRLKILHYIIVVIYFGFLYQVLSWSWAAVVFCITCIINIYCLIF